MAPTHSVKCIGSVQFIGATTVLLVVWLLSQCGLVAGNDHWAYQRPGRSELPRLDKRKQVVNAVDHFILDRLAKLDIGWIAPKRQPPRQLDLLMGYAGLIGQTIGQGFALAVGEMIVQ